MTFKSIVHYLTTRQSFELLSHLSPSLSNFSIANWQSTIRSYVTSHREYSNISPWRGKEKADIMYTDNNSTLTGLLIDKGYLPSNIWAGAKPLYYIEVKTTTGSCETPFYMSKYQYNRVNTISSTLRMVHDLANFRPDAGPVYQ